METYHSEWMPKTLALALAISVGVSSQRGLLYQGINAKYTQISWRWRQWWPIVFNIRKHNTAKFGRIGRWLHDLQTNSNPFVCWSQQWPPSCTRPCVIKFLFLQPVNVPLRNRKRRWKPKLLFVLELMHDKRTVPSTYHSTEAWFVHHRLYPENFRLRVRFRPGTRKAYLLEDCYILLIAQSITTMFYHFHRVRLLEL